MRLLPSTKTAMADNYLTPKCLCAQETILKREKLEPHLVEHIINEKIAEIREEYDKLLQNEIVAMKKRFDYILQNEQIRTSYMLREAHRERQEKIRALESNLHCKNLAALMYVMCSERTRSRLEKLQLIEEYTIYIKGLHELLDDGQKLILHLSRGYKTAARVDHEWREKMKKVIAEFMNFIYHFAGGPPENNQYFFDLPALLKTEAPLLDDLEEDPCEEESVMEEKAIDLENTVTCGTGEDKKWWETLGGENRPFIVFGDMADFKPPERRALLKTVKAKKTAPKVWKEYRFNSSTLLHFCENHDDIKDTMTYPRFNKHAVSSEQSEVDVPSVNKYDGVSTVTVNSQTQLRRAPAHSVDIRGGNMGSLLKLITTANINHHPDDKATLLGVKDSLEVMSTTKLKHHSAESSTPCGIVNEKLDIGKRHQSHFNEMVEKQQSKLRQTTDQSMNNMSRSSEKSQQKMKSKPIINESAHDTTHAHRIDNHCVNFIPTMLPEEDYKVNYERICPVSQCKRMQMDSFTRSLPNYMKANPFTHFQQTFEAYEPCTNEQMEILKERLKKKQEGVPQHLNEESPLKEWETGIATQTSDSLESLMSPCTCPGPTPSPVYSNEVFDLQNLRPVKFLLDAIEKECLFDKRIEFDRFEVIGQEHLNTEQVSEKEHDIEEFKATRAQMIKEILHQHPSLLDLFQANARC